MSAHVLVVDDSALVTGALRLLLEETGYRVSVAESVASAIRTARAERPDVVLLDLSLRDGDGLAILSTLAAEAARPRVAVALTGHDSLETRERCLRAGCREVLVKPIEAMALPKQIAGWLAETGAD